MDITYVKAVFGSLRKTRTQPVYRDDHDLILQLVGVKGLPVHFQAHFSNTEYGTAVVMMGSDGEVSIPNTLLATGLPIYCWILVEQGISGAVRYSVQIPVRQKARPDGTITPEQADIISQAISALNNAGTSAQEAADNAAQSAEYVAGVKDDLYEAIDRVGVLEEAKDTTLEAASNAEAWAVGNRGGSAVPSTDPAYHNNSKYYAEQAAESARTLTIDSTLTQPGQAADAAIVGAKAMLPRGTIASNTDIDTIKTLGTFTVSTLSVARTLTHWPCTGLTTGNAVAGSLIVFSHRESNSGASYGIVQVAISPDQMWYREYRSSVWSDWVFVFNSKYTDSVPTENSNYPVKSGGIYSAIKTVSDSVGDAVGQIDAVESRVDDAEGRIEAIEGQVFPEDKNVKIARLYGTKFYGHLFIDGIAQDATPIIPSESLAEIQLTKRLGFTIVEGHLKKTADGRYIVMHGVSGNIGYELITANNGEFTPNIPISSLTFDEIRTGYVYRSTEQKFMTPVVSAEEWLTACKIAGITPLVMCEDDDAVDLVKSYCGEDFILYNGTREQHSGIMFIYRNSLGDTVADAKSAIDSIYDEIGLPLIIEAFTVTQYTDAEFSEIIQYAHSKGILFGTANCYYNIASSRIIKSQICGVDIAASGWEVPAFENGNLLNLSSDFDFSEYTSAGTESNGMLQLTSGQTVTIGTQQSVSLGKGIVKIVYSGRITIDLGRYWKYGTTSGKRYDSDGTQELVFSTYYLDEEPTFLITALSATTIKSLVFKSSRC